ncbi:hypothetical protein [Bradyrhizobium sp. USDA 3315]
MRVLRRRDFLAGAALINGRRIEGDKRDAVVDPATGEVIAQVVRCDQERFDPQLKVGARIFKVVRDRRFISRAMSHGGRGGILGFAPPLVVSEHEIDEIVEFAYRATKQVMDELTKEPAM